MKATKQKKTAAAVPRLSRISAGRARGRPVLAGMVLAGLIAAGDALAATATWTGASGTDANWSNTNNWLELTLPNYTDVTFNDTGAVTDTNTVSNVVDYNARANVLRFVGTSTNTYQVMRIADGKTLSLQATNVPYLTNVLSEYSGNNVANDLVTHAAIKGANGTLEITNSDTSWLMVRQGFTSSPSSSSATLDLSGLGTLKAKVRKVGVGLWGANLGSEGGANATEACQRAVGALLLARTNVITTTTGLGSSQVAAITVAHNSTAPDAGQVSYLRLGQVNTLNTESIFIGGFKSQGAVMDFNPVFTGPKSLKIRGQDGTSRVGTLGIADSHGGSSSGNIYGTVDWSGATVDVLVTQMTVGWANQGASDSGTSYGTLTLDAGTLDVNTMDIGRAQYGNVGHAQGMVNVNGTATLVVNTACQMAWDAGGGAGGTGSSASLNINGGTVRAQKFNTSGPNTPTTAITNNGGSLVVIGDLCVASGNPLSALTLSNATLTLPARTANSATSASVTTLTTDGPTNIIKIGSLPTITSFPATFTLIKYSGTIGGAGFNFGLSISAIGPGYGTGFDATLVDNSANSSVDLVVTSVPTRIGPTITSFTVAGAQAVCRGANGLPGENYYVMATTNVMLPRARWEPVNLGTFDGNGGFAFTNALAPAGPEKFFALQNFIPLGAGIPTAPSGLNATGTAYNQIALTWTDNSSDEVNFKIERKTGSGGAYAQIATVGPNVTSYTDSTLNENTTYYYQVRASNGSGDSGYAPETNATTLKVTSGLVGFWKLDDGSGTNALDSSGLGNNGTLSGSNGSYSWNPAAQFGGGLDMLGSDAVVDVTNSPSLENLSAVTICAWVNDSTGVGQILQKGNVGAAAGFGLSLNGAFGLTFYGNYDTTAVSRQTPDSFLTPGTWQFVVATWDGGSFAQNSIVIYVNGAPPQFGYANNTSGVGARGDDRANPLLMGNDETQTSALYATLDEVRVYNRVLSGAEIQAIYNSGK